MNDTSPAAARLRRRLMMERSGAERLAMGCDMFDAARALMRAGLGDATGTDRSPALKVRLFERTYGRDFDPATVARIVERLRTAVEPTASSRRIVDRPAESPNSQGSR